MFEMEIKTPRRKKNCQLKLAYPLPIIKLANNEIYKFSGQWNGFSVIVKAKEEMKNLYEMGCFGKGNLSRGYPSFNVKEDEVQIIRNRTFDYRKRIPKANKNKIRKIIVVPDSESENEDYFTNLKPEYQLDLSCFDETLNLSLEEAFFLLQCVGCLSIYNNGELLTEKTTWEIFKEADKYFIQNYPVYCYFRAKKWVVKPGIKFGGDFLLYKDGPSFTHASCLIIIDVIDSETLKRRNDMCRRSMEIKNLLGLNRLCQTIGKELLMCQLLWPKEWITLESDQVASLVIKESVMRRWIPSQNREVL